MLIEDLRSHFPVLKNYTYLNTASSGLLSLDLLQWRSEHDKALLKKGSVFRDAQQANIGSVRTAVANFIGAANDEVALVPNFSFGFNTLLDGLPEGQKVLLVETDYPSINWAVEQRDFNVCYAELNGHIEQNIEQAIQDHRPDIFAFSFVQYINGIKIDLDFIAGLKEKYPELLLIADGTQFLGMESFNFAESVVDILGCSAYKWLLSGYGNGFFAVKEEIQKTIFPKTIGFNSANGKVGEREHIKFHKRFEPGHLDTLNFGSMEHGLTFLNRVGMAEITKRNKDLSSYAKTKFFACGLLEEAVYKRAGHSTIYNLKGNDQQFQKLVDNNIICSQRGDGIRVSFHFYNTKEELDLVCEILAND